MKRVSFYACRPCAKWAVRNDAAQYVGLALFFAVVLCAAAFVIKERDVGFQIGVASGLAVLVAVALAVRSLVPNTESNRYDEYLRDVATTRLKAKGKGDTHFTQAEYDTGFLTDLGDDQGPARPKTAAELLQGDDDDDRPRRRRKRPE